MRSLPTTVLAALVLCSLIPRAATSALSPPAVTIYDNDPAHLWNRLHQVLRVRQSPIDGLVGTDSVDPILWSNSKFLLEGESHRRALNVLDEFIAAHGERLIDDPLKRAVLQRDLWAIFDWTCERDGLELGKYAAERAALQTRLATAIRRLALTRQQIDALPNLYTAALASGRFSKTPDPEHPQTPYLAPDLLDEKGPWLNLFRPGEGIAAPQHVRSFGARSTFNVLLRHPQGREAGIAYLKQLSEFPEPYITTRDTHGRQDFYLNGKLPQFPAGTQVALLRRAMLIDADGKLAPTNLVETLQLRVFLIDPASAKAKRGEQSFHEFNFSRRELFTDPGRALRAVTPEERGILFVQFAGHGIDGIERPLHQADEARTLRAPVLEACFSCHGGAGIFSVNAFTRIFGPQTFSPRLGEGSGEMQFAVTTAAKRERYDFGLLTGLMRAGNAGAAGAGNRGD